MHFSVAVVLMEGFSSEHVKELERETIECLQSYYGNFAAILTGGIDEDCRYRQLL